MRSMMTVAQNSSAQPVTYTSAGTSVRLVMPPGWHIAADQMGSFNRPGAFSIMKAGTLASFGIIREHLELGADAYQNVTEEHLPQLYPEAKVLSHTPVTRSGMVGVRDVVSATKNGIEWRGWVEIVSIGDEHYRIVAIAPADRFASYTAEFDRMFSSIVLPGTSAATLSDSSLP